MRHLAANRVDGKHGGNSGEVQEHQQASVLLEKERKRVELWSETVLLHVQ